MFTGIVREVGAVAALEGDGVGIRIEVEAPATAPLVDVGGSVAVNGVCLTAEAVVDGRLTFYAVPETLLRSTLGELDPGTTVNLEPALRAGDPMGGHIVQGHVDAVGTVQSLEPEGEGLRLVVAAGADTLRYCVDKGSIAVEGVSLTVAEVRDDGFAVALIPHTLAETTLGGLVPGRHVNLEVDVLAKYAERLLDG
jgi:riboflavin synthase alpha subunit